MKPHAREDNLIIQDMRDELLVYDVERDHAHSLNRVTALVWRSSNGENTVAEIASLLRDQLDEETDEALVWTALSCLQEAHLLRETITPSAEVRQLSRRELMRKVAVKGGLTAAAFGVVSMAAPTPAEACHSGTDGGGGQCPPSWWWWC